MVMEEFPGNFRQRKQNKTDHNKMYVNDLRGMANSISQESIGCDTSSESFNAKVSGGGFGVSDAFGHSKAKESCSSAFNAASKRKASDTCEIFYLFYLFSFYLFHFTLQCMVVIQAY